MSVLNKSIHKEIPISNRYTSLTRLLAPILVLIFAVARDFSVLFSGTPPLGIDGYYYLLQIDALSTTGNFYFLTTTPLILYLVSGLSSLFGTAILAIPVGALLLHLSLSLAVFFVVKNLTASRWLGISALAICGLSGLHLYLIVEYINYLGAISFSLWAIYFGIRFAQTRQKLFLIIALVCVVLATGSHRSVIPITLLFLAILGSTIWLYKSLASVNRIHIYACLSLFLLILISPGLLAAQPFIPLPKEWAFEISFRLLFPARLATFPELLILFLGSIIFLIFGFYWKEQKGNKADIIFFGTIALWSLLITLNPFISSEFGFATVGGRLRVLAYIQAAFIVPAVVWLLRDKYPKVSWYVAAVVVPLILWSFLNPLPLGAQPDYLARRERLIEGLKSNLQPIDENSLILAAHGEQFVVTAITGIPSQQVFPEENKYSSVYWLLNLVPPTLLDSSMKIIAKDKVGSYTVLVKDGPAFRQRLQSPEVRQLLRTGNKPLDIFLAEKGVR